MNNNKTTEGQKKWEETRKKFKTGKDLLQEKELAEKEEAENALSLIQKDSELMRMYQENAKVGAENLGGSLPLLKVYSAGKSTAELEDGTDPSDGWFYYSPTKSQFETVDCHVLTISRGFRAKGLEDQKDIFNQILAGVITNDGKNLPFIMYFSGLKLENLWGFGKEASQWTRRRPIAIPMFALTVRLTTESVKHSYGKSWVVNFEILQDELGMPQLVHDKGEFRFLLDNVRVVEQTVEEIISNKSSEDGYEAVESVEPPHPGEYAEQAKAVEDIFGENAY